MAGGGRRVGWRASDGVIDFCKQAEIGISDIDFRGREGLNRSMMAIRVVLALVVMGSFSARAESPVAVPSGVTCEEIGTYDLARLKRVLTTELADFGTFSGTFPPPRFAVRLYRVIYPSVVPEAGNRPTVASGLLAVPEDAAGKTLPVVSYQHGTVFSREDVPSNPDRSMETRVMLAQFAAQGYVVVAADYFGKGVSKEPDGYLMKRSTEQACVDLLRAARAASEGLGVTWGPLFLSGWSQGGWNTMVLLRKLEALGMPVRAAATASSPNDLFALTNRWLHAPSAIDAVFLPGVFTLLLHAAQEYHGWPGLADSAIRPEYREAARGLYANTLTWDEAAKTLPKGLGDLLTPEFTAASSAGEGPFWDLLRESATSQWRSRTPLRTYFGEADEVVPPVVAQLPVAYQTLMGGGETVAVPAGKTANHRGTFLFGVADQKSWFDALQTKP